MTGRPPAADSDPPPQKGLFRSRLRDARIRSKLGLILVIPLIAVLVLAGLRLWDSGQRAFAAEQVHSLAAVSVDAADVSHLLHRERMAAARLLADPERDATQFNSRSAETDQAVEEYDAARDAVGSVPPLIDDRLAELDEHFDTLDTVRQEILDDTPVTVSSAVLRYGVVIADVLSYQEAVSEIAQDAELTEEIRALAALSKAKTEASEAEAIALVGLADGTLSQEQLSAFLATQTGQQEAFLDFAQTASPAQQQQVEEVVTGGNVVYADRAASAMIRSVDGELSMSPDSATAALSGIVNATRWVEQALLDDLLQTATGLRDAVLQQVLLEATVVLVLLTLAVALTVFLARMLARSLGALRQNATTVAERELPDTVQRLSDPATLGENTPEQIAAEVRAPIQLRSRDEIGEVAQAFNDVHRSAVRVAAEQAALRTSVSAMFLNLARRSQSLVDRMISQLDEIERHEEDPKRLAKLFTLDHLATRMRRNDENLLVLAGADSAPPRGDDAPIADALRAAQSEVEHYARIEFGTVDSDVSVVSHTVNDVVRLMAELFDNATRFSPPDSAVVCEARRLGDQLIIQIEDRGVGMPDEQVDRLNAWLASPPALEVTTFRKMGLAVVARLASRNDIRVELRCDPNYGTIAYVALPPAILQLPRSRARGGEIPASRAPLPSAESSPPLPSRHIGGQLPKRNPGATQQESRPQGSWQQATQEHPTQAGGQPPQPSPAAQQQPWQHQSWQSPAPGTGAGGAGTAGGGDAEVPHFDLPVAGRPLYDRPGYSASPPADSGYRAEGYGAAAGTPPPSAAPAPQQRSAPPPQPAQPAQPPQQPTPQHPEATVELPIFHQMEQSWFSSRHEADSGQQAQQQTPRRAEPAYSPGPHAAPAGDRGAAAGDPHRSGAAAAYATEAGAHAADASAYQPAHTPGSGAGHTDTSAQHASESWRTAADSGWRAAAAAAEPSSGGATQSGLPKRVPQAQLVPGSVETAEASAPSDSPGPQRRSPEEVRGLLSAYHRGVQRGRESGAR